MEYALNRISWVDRGLRTRGAGPRVVLALLTAAIVLSYVDRYVLAILIQPVKRDLRLTDTEIGWLIGFAFSAIYATLGVPIARFADRGFRRDVIVASLVVWSMTTALCGAVQNFWQLFAARVGVGFGEAGSMPASQSMVSDLFPYERRGLALAILGAGGGLGIMVAFALGAKLETQLGWRWTIVSVAIPGVLLSALIAMLVSEPSFGRHRAAFAEVGPSGGGMIDMLKNPAIRHLPFGQAGLVLLLFGQTQWLPAFIERSFNVPRTQIGAALALTQGLASLAGGIMGGLLADRLARRNALGPLRMAMLAIVAGSIAMMALYLSPSVRRVYPLLALMTFLFSMPTGPLFSLLQTVVNPASRATAAALSAMVASFIGLGLGPLVVGVLSDQLSPVHGSDSLRLAMLVIGAFVGPWTLFHLWRLHSALTSSVAPTPAATTS